MSRKGVISVIPKDYSNAFPTMETSLRQHGYSMAPGTFKMFFPYKEANGRYRTGLDPEATYILNISNPEDRQKEIERVTRLKERLEAATRVDLSPFSDFWRQLPPVKLTDGDNVFDLSNPWKEITFCWLKAYPGIASSLEAYLAGEYPPDTHFYVKDEDLEAEIAYRENKSKNDAMNKFESYSLEKRRKIARLVGLGISDDSKETVVYNAMDKFIRSDSIQLGPYKGQDPLSVFNRITMLTDEDIYVRDLVNTALSHQIYREGKGGKIYEGENLVFNNRDEMVAHYLDAYGTKEMLELEERIKLKKTAKG